MSKIRVNFRLSIFLVLTAVSAGVFYKAAFATKIRKFPDLIQGELFETIGQVNAFLVAADLNDRKPTYITIVPLRLSGPEILSFQPLPHGSVIQIVRKLETRWPEFLYPDKYYVISSSIINDAKLPVVLGLDRGNEGVSSILNPDIYRPIK